MSRARYVLCCGLFESFCLRLRNVVGKPVVSTRNCPAIGYARYWSRKSIRKTRSSSIERVNTLCALLGPKASHIDLSSLKQHATLNARHNPIRWLAITGKSLTLRIISARKRLR